MRTHVCLLVAIVGFSVAAGCAEIRVPDDVPSIQDAVAVAHAGDTVVVSPGTYYENVCIELRNDITLRGDVELQFGYAPCWDEARGPVLDVVIVGTIRVFASKRIRIETLTVTGPGAGITVDGLPTWNSADVSIFACNLICNEGMALELGEHYVRFAISCSNLCQNGEGIMPLAYEARNRLDIYFTCNRGYRSESELEKESLQGNDITVAVIDSGIDWAIPGLGCHQWRNVVEVPDNGVDDDGNGYIDDLCGWDFHDNDPDSLFGTSFHWHGTFVAGVLVDMFEGLVHPLVAPPRLRIMDLRFLDEKALFSGRDWPKLVDAIEYAVANGARVINLSIYATGEPPSYVRDAVQRAIEAGVIVVGIAGNDPSVLNPIGAWTEIITVGAVTAEGVPASFSGVGAEIDVASYGVNVLSLLPGGLAGLRSGTSFAAPRVAGLAAFYVAEKPELTPDEASRLLIAKAVDVGSAGHDVRTGHGVIE